MLQACFTSLKTLRNKSLLFLVIQLFYLPFVFSSNPYLEDSSENTLKTKSSWTCELDYECLNNLKTNLDKESKYSIYKVCQGEYDTVKTCCESLDNCPNLYGVTRELRNLKSNLLNSASNQAGCSAGNMSSLMSSIQGLQKNTCELGAKNCKVGCENKLNEFKRRVKRCFSISSSIDEALKEAKTAKVETTCYKRLKEAAEIYKRQSRNKESELREGLSVQDIVDCEGVKNKANSAVGTKKATEICSQANQELLQRQEAERQKKEEEERQQAEQKQKEEKERQAREEAKRAKEEERQRKAKEEKQRRKQSELKAMSQANKGQTDNNAEKPKAQASATNQLAESKKPQASDIKTINPLETEKEDKKEEGKEKANKEKAEKDKESKEEKKKEDESKKTDKKDKTKDTKPAKSSQTKSSVGSKAGSVALTGAVIGANSQPANIQTNPVLNSQKKESKKTAGKTKQTKNLKQAKKSNDVIASFDKTSADNTKLSQKISSTQTQSTENSSISSLAGNTEDTSQCPPMPEISSQVVYQSVEAPQIEPLNSETDPYNNYDLVANKPAVVLISLQPPQNTKDIEKHSITLKHIKLKNDITVFPKECSKVFNAIDLFPQKYFKFVDEEDFKKEFEEEFKLSFKESNCKLRRSDYKRNQRDIQKQLNKIKTPLKVAKEDIEDNLYVFVKLPTTTTRLKKFRMPEEKYISASLTNDNNKLCSKRSDFFISLRNTRKLYLDFMTVEYDLKTKRDKKMNLKCKPYEISDLSVLQSFSDSSEIQRYIPKMFPISEGKLFSRATTNIKIKATCYNKLHDRRYTSVGLLLDALTAENWAFNRIPTVPTEEDRPYKTKEGFKMLNRKTVVIVSEEYMKYHKKPDSGGFFLSPVTLGKDMTGSWNVIFVREDLKNRGTIAHELGHALGQKQEYYLLGYKNKQKKFIPYSNDQQDWCKKFSDEKPILCHTYKVFGGLMASFKRDTWRFLNNKFSIMSNKSDISSKWMDRETNQKLLRTLSDRWFNAEDSWNQKAPPPQLAPPPQPAPIVSISGIYNKEKGSFYRGSSLFYKKGFPTISNEKGMIEIRLVKRIETNTGIKIKTLSKINFSTDVDMNFISKNGEKETVRLNQVPIVANLPIPKEYLNSEKLKKSLRLIVRENFITLRPAKKKNPNMHNASLGGSSQSVSKKRRTVYNAPIDWEAKPEDFIIRK